MYELIEKAKRNHNLTGNELTELLNEAVFEEEIAKAADEVRHDFVGDGVHLRGLIEFSNICRQNCAYCGLRGENANIERYRMISSEILELAKKAKSYGYQTVVLQSGEDMRFSVDVLAPLIRDIHILDLAITLSIGERTYEEYRELKKAGADRYLLRIETTDKELYERLDPKMSYDNRVRCLNDLKSLGYEVGTGSIVGLPGQTAQSLANDILFFKEIDADMIGIGPFIPNPDTPLKNAKQGDFHLTRRMVSLTRLMLPDINIPATTATETIVANGREIMLSSGANVVMPNVTEGDYRRKYALYPGKVCVADTPAHCRNCMEGRIVAMGRFVAKDKGYRIRK